MRLYFSYDKGEWLTFERYLRHITKKWLKENGIGIERLRELAPHHDFKEV